ncbi:MAG: hypothetical protein AAB448_01525 [Patescibacteria group bacterium]
MYNPRGTTFIEVMLVVALLLGMFTFGGFALSRFQKSTASIASDRGVVNALSIAARRARSGASGTVWGVYIPYDESTRLASNIIVFSGTSYAARTVSKDMVFSLSDSIAFTSVDFSGSGVDATNSHEIVFAPLTGATTQYGSLVLSWFETTRTILIGSNGIPVRQ